MTEHLIVEFFAWTPLTAFVIILAVVYFATRREGSAAAVHGKTYACAQCGRRGKHEHMVPVTHEGAVVWYCGRCSNR